MRTFPNQTSGDGGLVTRGGRSAVALKPRVPMQTLSASKQINLRSEDALKPG